MGKVFTYDEIRHGRVPKPAAFDAAHALAREVFIRHAEICTAVLFGSYLRGEQT
jgi:predicted nucleotidyltransferase